MPETEKSKSKIYKQNSYNFSAILLSPKETLTLRGQFKLIYKTDGFVGFYRGLLPNLVKVVPSVSVGYFVYEKIEDTLGIKIP